MMKDFEALMATAIVNVAPEGQTPRWTWRCPLHQRGDSPSVMEPVGYWLHKVRAMEAFARHLQKVRHRCNGHSRHWFTHYGRVGDRQPFCVRGCGIPNPRVKIEYTIYGACVEPQAQVGGIP